MMKDNIRKTLSRTKRAVTLFYLIPRSIAMDKYGIRKPYICNVDIMGKAIPYRGSPEEASIFQYNVYAFARKLIVECDLKNILDIGCGLGAKLSEVIFPVCKDITGIDTTEVIAMCKRQHLFGRWLIDDLANPRLNLNQRFDLILAADVIEHLANPDLLLTYIKRFADVDTWIVLSTPERDRVNGRSHFGPSPNIAHVREWNRAELNRYIKRMGFAILEHFLTCSQKNSADENTQVVLCKINKS
jgi:2-polyprenyl-3-methyl-5-hydroxy-6-metoxy-1,4-benzoquinol methylase